MNPKRGLIGLFVTTFFVSGIGMAVLVADDKKDLSSRASIGLTSNLQLPLPEENLVVNSNTVEIGYGANSVLNVSYDPVIWIPPKSEESVFYHLNLPVTARIVSGNIDHARLAQVLGPDFISAKLVEVIESGIEGWSLESYSFNFFGAPKTVDVWNSTLAVSVISVMPDTFTRSDVQSLVRGITLRSSQQVKGMSSPDDTARLAALVRPSVVMILNNYCAGLKYQEKTYPYCLAQAGSGFFISKDGHIATNGHVITNLPETSFLFGVESGALDSLLSDYFSAYLTNQTGSPIDKSMVDQKVKEAHKNKETIYQMAALVQDLYKKNLVTIENKENQFYVQLGNSPIQLSKSGVNIGKDIVIATIVDSDYSAPDPVNGFNSSDVAIIKISGTGFPALPLGNIDDVSVGSDVLVIGFPGVVMGSNSIILDTSANAEPTFTKGVVSSFKQAKGNKKNLIQTDASINHGNSGGPALSSSGKVIGIATYGLVPDQGGGNYNFLRDIADLKDLITKNHIVAEESQSYTLWKKALDNYWLSYFKYAKDDFEKVIAIFPVHPTVNKYLSEAISKINTPEDLTPEISRDQRKIYINLTGGVMIFSIFMVIILSISSFIDSKRRRSPVVIPPRYPLPPRQIQTF